MNRDNKAYEVNLEVDSKDDAHLNEPSTTFNEETVVG